MASSIIEILKNILGDIGFGSDWLYLLIAGLLLVFVFHILEHLFEIFFSRFFKS